VSQITEPLRLFSRAFGLRDSPDLPRELDLSRVVPVSEVLRGIGTPGELVYLEDLVSVPGGSTQLVAAVGPAISGAPLLLDRERFQYQLLWMDFTVTLTNNVGTVVFRALETPLFPSASASIHKEITGFDAPSYWQAAYDWEEFSGHLVLPGHLWTWSFDNTAGTLGVDDFGGFLRAVWWKQPALFRSGIRPARGTAI